MFATFNFLVIFPSLVYMVNVNINAKYFIEFEINILMLYRGRYDRILGNQPMDRLKQAILRIAYSMSDSVGHSNIFH